MIIKQPQDWEERNKILNSLNSTVVLASAGSGKTTMLVDKLKYENQREKKHYHFATITFTNKAANEILHKIGDNQENIFCGTIDNFIDKEIVHNYLHSAYTGYSNFEISYQKEHQFSQFTEGLKQLRNSNILGTYVNAESKKGKNFKFELALSILNQSQAAREYLKYKYTMFFIDEYQDSDKSMNDLFIYLKNSLGIRLFIVGDIKQSIYQWRGASPNFLKKLSESEEFDCYKLTENFRSHADIVEYSRIISGEVIKEDYIKDGRIHYYHNKEQNSNIEILNTLISNNIINKSKKILILIGKNEDIETLYNKLGGQDSDFKIILRTPIDGTSNSLFLESICKYYYNVNYTEYDFINDLRYEYDKSIINGIKILFKKLLNKVDLITIEELYSFFGLSIPVYKSNLESELLLKTLTEKKYAPAFVENEKKKNYIMTTHSAKGLEFEQVIIFTKYYLNAHNFDSYAHYVGITRAKDRLVLIDDSGAYRSTINSLIQDRTKNKTIDYYINNIYPMS